jgi:metallo-beta-lactamase class B
MRRFLLIIFLQCTLSSIAVSQSDSARLKIVPLTRQTYVYTTYGRFAGSLVPSNSMYLVTDKGVVLIDTPWDSLQFQPLLDSIEARHHKKVVLCIATHFHADRTGGLTFLRKKGITTYTSKRTFDLCKEKNENQAQFYFLKDTTFLVGGDKIETFYPGEGHSPDNIVIWLSKEKVLYGGCLIKSTESDGLGNLSDANVKGWTPTMERLVKKYPSPAFIIPGHFGWNGNGVKHTLKLLSDDK